jgi:hypothetical protein
MPTEPHLFFGNLALKTNKTETLYDPSRQLAQGIRGDRAAYPLTLSVDPLPQSS